MKTLYRFFPLLILVSPIILFIAAIATAGQGLDQAAAQLAIAGAIALLACVVFLRDTSPGSPS